MERREFLTVAGAVAGAYRTRNAEVERRNRASTPQFRVPRSAFRVQSAQEPSLSPEVFSRRLARAQAELATRRLDFLIATPSTNYEYLTAYNPGRSERLIALVLPAGGAPVVVCPSFEVERIKRHSTIAEVRGWEEQADPYPLVRDAVRSLATSGRGTIALEPSTGYETYLRLAASLGGGWQFVDGAPVTERLRIIKAPEEVALIRRAIEITEGAIAAAVGQLAGGTTERDVAQLLSREMQQRGAERAAARRSRRRAARAGDGRPHRLRLPGLRLRLRYHAHDLVRRPPVGRVPQGVRRRARRTDRGDAARPPPCHAMPGDGPRGAKGDRGRGLRPLLHPPPRSRPRHGWARGALPRRGQRHAPRARHGVHHRARDLPAREVRGQDRGRLLNDGERRRGAVTQGGEALVPQLLRKCDDAVQCSQQVVRRRRVRQPHVAVVSERGPRHERHAGGGDEPSAEFRAAQSAEGIHPKEEVEGPQGVDELDPRQLLPEPRHHEIAPLAELGHHPRDVLLHPFVAERRRGGELRRMVRARRGVRLQRRHRSRHRAGSERRADAPPGHRVRFADTVDHDDALQQIVGQVEKRRRRPRAVMDASVDLVRDDPHLPLARPLRDRLDLGVGVHRPRGIAR